MVVSFSSFQYARPEVRVVALRAPTASAMQAKINF